MSERRYTTTSEWFEATEPVGPPVVPVEPGNWRWLSTTTTDWFVSPDGSVRFVVIWTWENEREVSRNSLHALAAQSFGPP